jgi:hypothetical protein
LGDADLVGRSFNENGEASEHLLVELEDLSFRGGCQSFARTTFEALFYFALSFLDNPASLRELRFTTRQHGGLLVDRSAIRLESRLGFPALKFAIGTALDREFERRQLLAQRQQVNVDRENLNGHVRGVAAEGVDRLDQLVTFDREALNLTEEALVFTSRRGE